MIQYNIPSSNGVEIFVKQGEIDAIYFPLWAAALFVVLPFSFFNSIAGIKYFTPYCFILETTDVAVPVIVPINLSFAGLTTPLTQVLPTQGSALYTCGIIPFNGANQFDENNYSLGGSDLVLYSTVNSPLANYGNAKYTLLYSLIDIV
jgi:hypothetical protein